MRCDAWNGAGPLHSMEEYATSFIPQLCCNWYPLGLNSRSRNGLTKILDANETEADRLFTVLDSWVRSSKDQGEPSSTYTYLFEFLHFTHVNRGAPDTLV
jgi:hypothetical protein